MKHSPGDRGEALHSINANPYLCPVLMTANSYKAAFRSKIDINVAGNDGIPKTIGGMQKLRMSEPMNSTCFP